MDILIVKLSAIGDVIHTLPALEALHQRYPESTIHWVVEEKASGIIKGHPYVQKVFISRRKQWLHQAKRPALWYATVKEIVQFIRELRAQRYDVVIDFQGLLKSALLVWLSKGKRKIGYDKTREFSAFFLNEKVPPLPSPQHAVMRNLHLARYLGAETEKVAFPMCIGEEDTMKVHSFLTANHLILSKPLIVLHARAGWRSKEWAPAKMAALADRLIQEYGAQVIFIGGGEEHSLIASIVSLMSHAAINAAGATTLPQLACLLSLSHLMISVDSGPMHLASAMNTPLVALFGPTAPWKTGPYGNSAIVVSAGVHCSPCFKRHCEHRRCMQEIEVEEVVKAAAQQLARSGYTAAMA